MADEALVVGYGDGEHRTAPGDSVSFGRSAGCTICLDPDDPAISRLAGTVEHDGGVWWLTNSSGSRQLAVVDELGFRSVLAPGRRVPVEGRLRVIVDGRRSHELVLHGPAPSTEAGPPTETGVPTSVGEGVLVNDADRRALVALFAGYLEEGARYDPYPKSYAAAAARLGCPRTTLV
ncbi:MAG: hypothetical protein AUI14_07745, partial [Actinobacteria bacterium 13_2_20CM_2_71_6]